MESAVEIARQVRAGERSAVEVTNAHLERIAEREGEIHAFNLVTHETALAQAEAVDAKVAAGENPGPLAGVPLALKDNMCTRGIPTTCSSKILEGWVPPYNATVVDLLTAAGAITVGKTNLDEFAMGSSTENSAFGPTKNPLDTTRVPGGSSGGSAAAVAAGFAPLAIGSDTGGSIRQPASLCGVVGVKPTYGRVSRYGLIAFASSFDQIGPFAADVADAALLMDSIAGHDSLDSTSIPVPYEPVSSTLDQGVEGLRIGVLADQIELANPDVCARLDQAVAALEAAGATVGQATVPAAKYGLTAYYLIAPAEASSNLSRFDGVRYGLRVDGFNAEDMMINSRTAGFGDEVKARIMLGTFALSAGYYDAYYGKAQKLRSLVAQEFAAAYQDFDLLISPTSPSTAFKIGELVDDPLAMYACDVFTIPSNLSGDPAMSVPYGTGDDGLPIGVQLLGSALTEPVMFRAAQVLENAANQLGGAK